jgi:tRNA pseudouridine38-40 synthase
MSFMPQRSIRLVLAYDGSGYSGWQRQKNARSVQEELEKALAKMHGHEVRVTGAGRTDSGVHAMGQTAGFETDIASIQPDKFVPALNHLLPKDIRILDAKEAPPDFHARFDASLRRYRYFIIPGGTPDPFTLRYAFHVNHVPSLEKLNAMASEILGERDFTTFSSAQDKSLSKNRFIQESSFWFEGSKLIYQIAGNAFLWRMVRSLVGTMLFFEPSLSSPGEAAEFMGKILESKDRIRAGPTAPPYGLFLWSVEYEERVHGHARYRDLV